MNYPIAVLYELSLIKVVSLVNRAIFHAYFQDRFFFFKDTEKKFVAEI